MVYRDDKPYSNNYPDPEPTRRVNYEDPSIKLSQDHSGMQSLEFNN